MRLTVLGSGGIKPTLDRAGSAYLVSAQGRHILLDAGPGALRWLLRTGVTTADLDGVCITHRHPDHCCELILLIELEDAMGRKAPLGLAGPAILDDYLTFFARWGRTESAPPPYPIERAVLPGDLEWSPFGISGRSVPHVENCVGFRIEVDGKTLVYPGDCGPSDVVVDMARGADMLVLECTLPEGVDHHGHLNSEQAAQIAERAGVGKLVLSHFSPNVDVDQAVAICRKRGIDALAAEDGLVVEV